jgi:hypothetical protein
MSPRNVDHDKSTLFGGSDAVCYKSEHVAFVDPRLLLSVPYSRPWPRCD